MNPLFITLISTGTVFIIAGIVLLKFPPKRINWIYGYRTPSSMKSQENWDFAQTYSAKELIKLGIVTMILSLTGFLFNPNNKASVFVIILPLVVIVFFLIGRVELAIKKNVQNKKI